MAAALLLGCAGLVTRVALLERQGLWVDEVFSLAMATGHSLEHPPLRADPARGDFVEPPPAVPAAVFRRYVEHEAPPAGPGRVLRAVLLSDTSPPLYYLMLYAWTLGLGTSDAALRAFSVLWAVLSLPLAWRLGAALGGRPAALPSLALFALAPLGVYYSTEGRMYSLLAFLSMATALLTLRLQGGRRRPVNLSLWVAASAAGLLTHYFFVFPWAAMTLWLLLRPGRVSRPLLLGAIGLVCVAVLPWYARVPESLASWRVTDGWLAWRPPDYQAVLAPFRILRSFISGRGPWGGPPQWDHHATGLAALALGALFWRLGWRRALAGGRGLAWLWLAAACLGPLVFDAWRGTFSSHYDRYAHAGLPAMLVLMAVGIARLPPTGGAVLLAYLLLAWLPGLWQMRASEARIGSPFREVARELSGRAGPNDVVLVHSIPSGIAGIARYLEGPAPVAAWVGQLRHRRVPDDAERLAAGRHRVFLVVAHATGAPAPEEDYLRRHARVIGESRHGGIRLVEFAPSPAP